MKQKKLVSVIIPVHNSSKYLDACLKSITSQTYKNIEIIAIENGSTDNSLEILNKYKDKIKIEILKKAGLSIARNKGIELSKGEYIAFLDSDDTVEKTFIEKLVKNLEENQSDLSCCDINETHESTNKEIKRDEYPREEINEQEINKNLEKFNYAIWNKLYKKEIIIKNNILFPLNLKYEDIPFVLAYITKCKKISKVNEYLYNYLIHSESEQTTIDIRVFDIIKILEKCKSLTTKENLENVFIKELTTYSLKMRYVKDKKLRNEFIDEAYKNLSKEYPNWKNSNYIKSQSLIKQIIVRNKGFVKIYTHLYSIKID